MKDGFKKEASSACRLLLLNEEEEFERKKTNKMEHLGKTLAPKKRGTWSVQQSFLRTTPN